MNDLDFKIKYIKYKLKYLQLKQKKQSGGTKEKGEEKGEGEGEGDNIEIVHIKEGSPSPASALKVGSISHVSGDFPGLVQDIIRCMQHSSPALNIARFISDVLHDIDNRSRQLRVIMGRLSAGNSRTLLQKHLESNMKIIRELRKGGYDTDDGQIFTSINKYHGDSQIGVLDKPTSKFGIQSFMNMDIPKGYYFEVNIGEETELTENMCIGIIDKGSEGRDVQPGKIWADGNTWFLDGLKSIPENLDDFRRRLPTKLQRVLPSNNTSLIEMLKSIAQGYFNSILNGMFDVNNHYKLVKYVSIDLEKHDDGFFTGF